MVKNDMILNSDEEITASNFSKETFKPTFIDIDTKRYENLTSPISISMSEHKRLIDEKNSVIQKLTKVNKRIRENYARMC